MDIVYKLYIALFERAPEKEGVDYWYKELIKNNFDYSLIANEMINAASNYSSFYPQYKNIDLNSVDSIKPIIENIYKILFNKTFNDDPSGIDYWTNDAIKYKDLGSVVTNIIRVADGISNKEINADETTYNYAVSFENKTELSKYVSEKFQKFDGDFSKFQNFIKKPIFNDTDFQNSITLVNDDVKYTPTYDSLSLGAKSLLINNGAKIQKNVITYSFPATMPSDYEDESDLTNNWTPLNYNDKELVREVFEKLSQFLPVTFKEVEDGDIRFSKINIANTNEAGFTEQSIVGDDVITDGIGSDIFLSNTYNEKMSGEDVVLHEIGHALGLKHPFEGNPTLTYNDDVLHTIMSYTQKETYLPKVTINKNDDGSINYSVSTIPLGKDNYGDYDIEALQYLYGKKDNNLGNNVIDESNIYNNYGFDDVFDDGGIDTLNLSNCNDNTSIYLEGGDKLSSVGKSLPVNFIKNQVVNQLEQNNISSDYFDEIYQDVMNVIDKNPSFKDMLYQGEENLTLPKNQIENLVCGNGNDYIEDNKLDNIIYANGGDDTIIVKSGNDFIDGGDGKDFLEIYDNNPYDEYEKDNVTYLVFDDKVVSFTNIEDWNVV